MELKIIPEFRDRLPPMQDDKDLEALILEHGCLDALKVWNGYLLDGHRRLAICERHKIPYEIKEINLADIEHALHWIDLHSFASYRNYTAIQLSEIVERILNFRSGSKEAELSEEKDESLKRDGRGRRQTNRCKAFDEVARSTGLSTRTIRRAEETSIAMKALPSEIRDRVRLVKSATMPAIIKLATLTPAQQDESLKLALSSDNQKNLTDSIKQVVGIAGSKEGPGAYPTESEPRLILKLQETLGRFGAVVEKIKGYDRDKYLFFRKYVVAMDKELSTWKAMR